MRRAKIVSTLGPASSSYEVIKALVKNGMDIARINRSHGDIAEDEKVIAYVRKAAEDCKKTVGVLADIQGPKIRLGRFVDNEPVQLEKDAEFRITSDDIQGTVDRVSTTYKEIIKDVTPGEIILVDDGKIKLEVTGITETDVITKVVVPGPVSNNKGINLPNTIISLPTLTEKDEKDLRWALHADIDMIALSFVRKASDFDVVKKVMDEEKVYKPIIAKIEKPQAVKDLENIVDSFDGIMVARGDLGVELPFQKVPLIQKRAIDLCRRAAKPVIVATQALESMIHSSSPTRAEVSDVANSILDGADATMTSGETAMGDFPVEVVRTMDEIIQYQAKKGITHIAEVNKFDEDTPSAAIATAAFNIARKIGAKYIIALTETGSSVRSISRFRGPVRIVALTPYQRVKNNLQLCWGVDPHLAPPINKADEVLIQIDKKMLALGKVKIGDKVVVMYGAPIGLKGSTNSIIAHKVGIQGIVDAL
jgi:pyruvate kinase